MALLEKLKDLLCNSFDFTQNQKDIVKLKLKIYGIQKKIDSDLTCLGDIVFDCFEADKKDILTDKRVTNLIESITKDKKEVEKTEDEISDIKKRCEKINCNIKGKGKEIFADVKKCFSSCEDTARCDTPPSAPPCENKDDKDASQTDLHDENKGDDPSKPADGNNEQKKKPKKKDKKEKGQEDSNLSAQKNSTKKKTNNNIKEKGE